MSTRTTLHRLALASAVAAMLASAGSSAFAQAADTTAPPPTAAPMDSTAPMPMSSMPMSGSSAVPIPPMNFPTDYSILSNRVFDSVDLQQARARGLSEAQIATIVKISKDTGYSFREVSAKVEQGETFASLATMYGLKLNDVYSNDKEKQQVSDYDVLSNYADSLSKNSSGMMPATMPATMPAMPPVTPAEAPAVSSQLDIVQTAMAAKNLTTLVKALQAAGLVETLKGAGPFTVFAPDDKAFSKLPTGALDALLADPVKLKQVLTYHVIPGNIMAADAANMTSPTSPPTVNGATLQVTKRKGKLKINDATVIKADIKASNGTIHIIDSVLMPPTPADTTVPPLAPAPMNATPPAVPDTTTPPAAPATPGTMDMPPAPAQPAVPAQ